MWYLSQVREIGLVFGRHEDDAQTVVELHLAQRSDAHVEEDAVQDGHGDELEHGRHEHGQTDQQEDDEMRQPLFPARPRPMSILEWLNWTLDDKNY